MAGLFSFFSRKKKDQDQSVEDQVTELTAADTSAQTGQDETVSQAAADSPVQQDPEQAGQLEQHSPLKQEVPDVVPQNEEDQVAVSAVLETAAAQPEFLTEEGTDKVDFAAAATEVATAAAPVIDGNTETAADTVDGAATEQVETESQDIAGKDLSESADSREADSKLTVAAAAPVAEQSGAGSEQPSEINTDKPVGQEVEASEIHAGQSAVADAAEEKESFFTRLRKTRENLASGFSALLKGRVIDEDLYEDLETALLTADLGVETTAFVIEKLREEAKLRELHDASLLRRRLQQILTDLLKPCEIPLDVTGKKPFVILMVGVNGAGKTTTIGKLTRKFTDQGLKVMLAAGDTFRAAAVEQLKEWGRRASVPVISQPTGSDSASVLFDALSSAKARQMDVLICDTAGRLQNKAQLMDELKKIVRVLKKQDPEVPHEVLLVLDASTGQNAVSQTKIFKEACEVTGLCLTKLDGTAKGGVVFALANKFGLPLRFVGLGEKAEDLRSFKADVFTQALLREDHA